jgi:GntR family transcriptional regulator, rspAB operon transcriptional repressor
MSQGATTMDRRNSRLASQVFAHLREAIVRGEFPPNTALSEQDLCERLNVSRTPVREALINLAEEELVVIYPQFGTFVAPISLSAVRVGQYVREHLECALVVDAVRRLDDAGIARIRDNMERQAKAPSLEEFYNLDNDFHFLIAELSGYPKVWNVILKAKTQFDRVRYLSVHEPSRIAEILAEHRTIADAVIARDAEEAQQALRQHLRGVFATVEKMGLAETSTSTPPKRKRRPKAEAVTITTRTSQP